MDNDEEGFDGTEIETIDKAELEMLVNALHHIETDLERRLVMEKLA